MKLIVATFGAFGIIGVAVLVYYIFLIGAAASIESGFRDTLWISPTPPVWFPDGEDILFQHEEVIYAIDTDGRELRRLAGGTDFYDTAYSPAISSDGSLIIYTGSGAGYWEIFRITADGSDKRRLVENAKWIGEIHPTWSTDGTQVFFVADEPRGIYVARLDGSQPPSVLVDYTRLSNHWVERPYLPLSLSPDGTRMAFVVRWGRQPEQEGVLFTVGTDGTQLALIDSGASGLTWSPDSQQIAYVKGSWDSYSPVALGLYAVTVEDGDAREVISFPEGSFPEGLSPLDSVAWSPDGSEILLGTRVIQDDGSGVRELHGPGNHASWSHDGDRVAVYVQPSPPYSPSIVLYTVARDGSDPRVLVEEDEEGRLVAAGGRPLV